MRILPSLSSLIPALVFLCLTSGCGSDDQAAVAQVQNGPLLIETDKGPVQGALLGTTRTFLGIPFAAPPVGDLRWRAPAPHEAWSDALDASAKGPACAQLGALSGSFDKTSSEDCLTLNVWTPQRLASTAPPVLVWIHGGAFILGSGGADDYDGQLLSEATGAVVVTVNYRLGPFGFLSLPSLKTEDPAHPSAGGYGLEDQRAALQWVKTNIAAFGGDAGRVTIFGESAGGISVCMHLVSPPSAGLFHRAIIESGPCDNATPEMEANTQGESFLTALGCDIAKDPLGCARSKSTEEIATALPVSSDLLFGDGASWFPVLDGWNLPDAPGELLAAGKFEKVPTIAGSNANEAALFFALGGNKVADEAAFEAFVETLVPGHGKDIAAKYPTATYGSAEKAAIAAVGDAGFVCPTRRTARAIAEGGAPSFLYHFTYAPKGGLLGDLGAFHSAEIRYIFGLPGTLLPQSLTEEELSLWSAMRSYWGRFAAGGDPMGEGAARWPKYDAATDESLRIAPMITTEAGLKKDLCDFWDGIKIPSP